MQFLLLITLFFGYAHTACSINKNNYCDDMEMYGQCHNVQMLINSYCTEIINLNHTYTLINKIPQLNCDQDIMCYCYIHNFCQNMNAYQKCQSLSSVLDTFLIEAQKYTSVPTDLIANKPTYACKCKTDISGPNIGICNYSGAEQMIPSIVFIVMLLMLFE
jgi:hypothetical protein